MVDGLRELGIEVDEFPDGVRIRGGEMKVDGLKAMAIIELRLSFAIAAIAAKKEIIIEDLDNIATSFQILFIYVKR